MSLPRSATRAAARLPLSRCHAPSLQSPLRHGYRCLGAMPPRHPFFWGKKGVYPRTSDQFVHIHPFFFLVSDGRAKRAPRALQDAPGRRGQQGQGLRLRRDRGGLCRARGGPGRGCGGRGGGGTRGGGHGGATAQLSGGGRSGTRGGSAGGGLLSPLARPSRGCFVSCVSGRRKAVAGGRSPVRARLGVPGMARGSRRVTCGSRKVSCRVWPRPDATVQSLSGGG